MTKTAQSRLNGSSSPPDAPDREVDDLPLHRALGPRRRVPPAEPDDLSLGRAVTSSSPLNLDYQDRAEDFLLWLARVDRESQPSTRPADPLEYRQALPPRALRGWAHRDPRERLVPKAASRCPAPELAQICASGVSSFSKPVIGATAQGTLRFDADLPEGSGRRAPTSRAGSQSEG